MGLRESGEDGALLRCSESRKVTLGRIAFLSAAFVFGASHPSAADFTRLQERVKLGCGKLGCGKLGCGKVEFCLTKLQALRATSSTFASLRLIDVLNAFGLFAGASEYLAQDRGRRGVAESRDQMVQGAPVSTGAEPILADASVAFAAVTCSAFTDSSRVAHRVQ